MIELWLACRMQEEIPLTDQAVSPVLEAMADQPKLIGVGRRRLIKLEREGGIGVRHRLVNR
jgi:hypothetical protein